MKKALLAVATLAALSMGSNAAAQTDVYYDTAVAMPVDGEMTVMEYTTMPAPLDGDSGTFTVSAVASMPPTPSMGTVTPMQKRETNRQLIERMRKLKQMQNSSMPSMPTQMRLEHDMRFMNGSTSLSAEAGLPGQGGSVRIYRAENGVVVEDRMMTLPTSTRGKPVLFRLPAVPAHAGQAGVRLGTTSSTTMSHGFVVRGTAASGSNAVFLRLPAQAGDSSSSSLPLPFLRAIFGNPDVSSTSASAEFEFQTGKPRLEKFMDTMLKMLKTRSETRVNVIQNIQ